MPSRRHHTKSRHGCLLCKTRRVKCDLAHPTCGSCAKRGRRCSLEDEIQWSTDGSRFEAGRFAGSSSRITHRRTSHGIDDRHINHLGGPLLPLADTELSLLRRFSSEVVLTFVESPDCLVWASVNYYTGYAPSYMIHCMLSISAIHCSQASGLSDLQVEHYRNLGIYHENIALSLMRPELTSIGPENCEALYGSTTLIFLSSVAVSRPKNSSFLEELVELSELARGTIAIRQNSPCPPIGFYEVNPWDDPIPLPKELIDPLENMRQHIDSSFTGPEDSARKSIYLRAIDTLKETLNAVFHNKSYPLIIFMFVTMVDRQFIHLVALKDVIALRILGHYGLCACYVQGNCWTRHWGQDIIDAVLPILNDSEMSLAVSGAHRECTFSPTSSVMST